MTNPFTEVEMAYLSKQLIGRLATVTPAGHVHVVPTSFHVDDKTGAIEIGACDLADRGQKRGYRRNINANPQVAYVVDDLASVKPWMPRGVSIWGHAELQPSGGERLGCECGPSWVRITPTWISSWGIENGSHEPPRSRKVGRR